MATTAATIGAMVRTSTAELTEATSPTATAFSQ